MLVEEKDLLKERLKEIFGYSQFRGNQETIIRNLLDGRNTFVIMPTGAGKSLNGRSAANAITAAANRSGRRASHMAQRDALDEARERRPSRKL